MSEIKYTDATQGPPDGVEADIQCVITKFEPVRNVKQSGTGKKIKSQAAMSCHAMCSYENGVLSLSVRGLNLMVSVRLDEIYAILAAASQASAEQLKTLLDEAIEEIAEAVEDIEAAPTPPEEE